MTRAALLAVVVIGLAACSPAGEGAETGPGAATGLAPEALVGAPAGAGIGPGGTGVDLGRRTGLQP